MFPGGGTWFNQTNGYAVAGAHIYDIATQMNEKGHYFPLFGTCLGFELLLFISNNNQEYRAKCSSQRQALPLNFTKGITKIKHFVTQFTAEINSYGHFDSRFQKQSTFW